MVDPLGGAALRAGGHRGARRRLDGLGLDRCGSRRRAGYHRAAPGLLVVCAGGAVISAPWDRPVRRPPPGENWDRTAFFAGAMIVSALTGPGPRRRRLVAVDPRGKIADLDEDEGGIAPPGRRRHVADRHPHHDPPPHDGAERRGDPRPGAPVATRRRRRRAVPMPASAGNDPVTRSGRSRSPPDGRRPGRRRQPDRRRASGLSGYLAAPATQAATTEVACRSRLVPRPTRRNASSPAGRHARQPPAHPAGAPRRRNWQRDLQEPRRMGQRDDGQQRAPSARTRRPGPQVPGDERCQQRPTPAGKGLRHEP